MAQPIRLTGNALRLDRRRLGCVPSTSATNVLGDGPVVAGESAVAGLAAMLLAAGDPASRRLLKLDENSVALVIGTEGATDPAVYGCIVGRLPESVFPGWTSGPKCEEDD
jgi:hypothetical protein